MAAARLKTATMQSNDRTLPCPTRELVVLPIAEHGKANDRYLPEWALPDFSYDIIIPGSSFYIGYNVKDENVVFIVRRDDLVLGVYTTGRMLSPHESLRSALGPSAPSRHLAAELFRAAPRHARNRCRTPPTYSRDIYLRVGTPSASSPVP